MLAQVWTAWNAQVLVLSRFTMTKVLLPLVVTGFPLQSISLKRQIVSSQLSFRVSRRKKRAGELRFVMHHKNYKSHAKIGLTSQRNLKTEFHMIVDEI
jgi:hypothetical protein